MHSLHEKTSRKPVLPLLFAPFSQKGPHRVRKSDGAKPPIRQTLSAITGGTCRSLTHRSRLGALLGSHLPHISRSIPLSLLFPRGCSLESFDKCTLFVNAFRLLFEMYYIGSFGVCKGNFLLWSKTISRPYGPYQNHLSDLTSFSNISYSGLLFPGPPKQRFPLYVLI